MGRKTKYDPDTFPLLTEGMARDGMIDKDIANDLGVSEYTFYIYLKKYPKFVEALKKGRAPVNTRLENNVIKLADGYEYEETTRETIIGPDGKIIKEKTVTKHLPPNLGANAFILKNRLPDKWKDRQHVEADVTNHLGKLIEDEESESKEKKDDRH